MIPLGQKINLDCFSDDPDSTFKSTRHIPSDGSHYGFNHFGPYSNPGFPVTPVSTITVFGLIGDFCITDADCQVPNSACSIRSRRFENFETDN